MHADRVDDSTSERMHQMFAMKFHFHSSCQFFPFISFFYSHSLSLSYCSVFFLLLINASTELNIFQTISHLHMHCTNSSHRLMQFNFVNHISLLLHMSLSFSLLFLFFKKKVFMCVFFFIIESWCQDITKKNQQFHTQEIGKCIEKSSHR